MFDKTGMDALHIIAKQGGAGRQAVLFPITLMLVEGGLLKPRLIFMQSAGGSSR